jgi:N-acetylglutamate synthase-like GNAT family acetyltransferase
VDLRPRLDEPAVRELLGDAYRDAHTLLLGVTVEKSWEVQDVPAGTPIACIGLQPTDDRSESEITALAVLPDWRGQGIAKALVFGACEHAGLRAVKAETDADATGFFRAIGFTVESVGEQHPGLERFRCRLELPPR